MKTHWQHVLAWSGGSKSFLIALFIVSTSLFGGLQLLAQTPLKTESLFDGKTLTGWKTVDPAHASLWSVKDSVIRSGDGVKKIPENTYLYTLKEYSDFEFRCLFRLYGDPATGMINSGIQYRSVL